jgi:hypothetical protein
MAMIAVGHEGWETITMRTRYRIRIKRWAWVAARWAVAPALLLGLRLAWGVEATGRLAREHAALRSEGIRLSMAEYPSLSTIPPQDNAHTYLMKAVNSFDLPWKDSMIVNQFEKTAGWERVEFTPEEIETFNRLWEERKEVIANLDLAAARQLWVWPNEHRFYDGRGYDGPLRFTPSVCQKLSYWCLDQALLDVAHKRHVAAIINLRRAMTIARITDDAPVFLASLIARWGRSDVMRVFERLDPLLDWSDPAVVAEARKLLADMLAVPPPDFLRAWSHEFLEIPYRADNFRQVNGGWWVKPLFDLDEARALRRLGANLPAARGTTFPEMGRLLVPFPPAPEDQFSTLLLPLSSDVELRSNLCRAYFTFIVDHSAATYLLAARLHFCDLGRFPNTAAELVPHYLPRLLADPFDPTAAPLHYRLDAAGPTLWSVGDNGTDEGGTPNLKSAAYRQQQDYVYGAAWRAHLAALPP